LIFLDGYYNFNLGQIHEGDILEETRENFKEALELILQCRKETLEKEASGTEIIKESIRVFVP